MIKTAIFITFILISYSINAQGFMDKITIKEGVNNPIKYKDLNISSLLGVYDENSAEHLIGDIYLKVLNNDKIIAEFYIDYDYATREYNTRIYKNYFFTFMIEESHKYLVIEPADFGKVFALSSLDIGMVGNNEDLIEIEITDFFMESGYDAPIEGENRNYYSDVNYSLKVTVGDLVKTFGFYSSEINEDFAINIADYRILILSDIYKDSSSLIEMKVNKK